MSAPKPSWPKKGAPKKAPAALKIMNLSTGAMMSMRAPSAMATAAPKTKKPAAAPRRGDAPRRGEPFSKREREPSPPPPPPPNRNAVVRWRGNVRNTPIQFPFEPYACQLDFMEKALEAVETGRAALLESPTGTLAARIVSLTNRGGAAAAT